MTFLTHEVDGTDLRQCPVLMVYSAAEFLDSPVPEQKWLIPGLIPQGVPLVLASKGGLGKSWLALQACVALAAGKPYFDYEVQPPRGAAYFGLEDSKGVVHKRIRAIVDLYRFADDWDEDNDSNLRKNLAILAVNWDSDGASSFLPDLMPNISDFIELADGAGIPPGLLVLDTLARFSDGDENTVSALRPILITCNRIAHTGWTPLMLHHVGKGQDGAKAGKDKPSIADRMSTDWVRGSSSIVDNFRGVLQLAALREDEAERAGIDPDKARAGGYLILGATKTNGAARGEWRLLEQGESGPWFLPQDAYETLAKVRGGKAVEALSKQMALLVDLYHATRMGQEADKDLLAKKYCGETKNPLAAFRLLVFKLRAAGFLQKKELFLTVSGVQRVKETGIETERCTND